VDRQDAACPRGSRLSTCRALSLKDCTRRGPWTATCRASSPPSLSGEHAHQWSPSMQPAGLTGHPRFDQACGACAVAHVVFPCEKAPVSAESGELEPGAGINHIYSIRHSQLTGCQHCTCGRDGTDEQSTQYALHWGTISLLHMHSWVSVYSYHYPCIIICYDLWALRQLRNSIKSQ
jgi:hypothetical protein